MQRLKRWTIAPPHPQAAELAQRLRTSPLLAQILLSRGIEEPQDCADFLRPTPKLLADPALLPNLAQAAQRIARAIREGKKIVVYGDYDVDGITATAILWHAIVQLGGQVDYYIPHRIEEGYGLNAEALEQICQAGAGLIISVDCGITAIEQARVCRAHGVDLIITDHHEWHGGSEDRETRGQGDKGTELPVAGDGLPVVSCQLPHDGPGSELPPQSPIRNPQSEISGLSTQHSGLLLPDCFAIVHPRLPGSRYPNPHLCGAGVAFKLAWGVGLAMNGGSDRVSDAFRQFLCEATALAALGTIADVVPLVGENRVLAHWGLSGLKQSKLSGIQALIASANLTGQTLDSYHVGFLLAPRLNACGRMGHAREAVEMLTKADPDRAREIAVYLEKQNRQRQEIEKKILEEALGQVAQLGLDKDECRAIVLFGEGWHPGVIGIVASRIVDRLHRPTIMIATTNGHGQGSGRSIPGFHLSRALEHCAGLLEGFGGHEMAAGLKISTANVPAFREAFGSHAAGLLCPDDMLPELRLEAVAQLEQINQALVTDLARLGPFGHGNPRPLLACTGVTVVAQPRRVGKTGDHLQVHLRQCRTTIKCIAFNAAHLADKLRAGAVIDVAVEPQLNTYMGWTSVELEIRDVHFPQ